MLEVTFEEALDEVRAGQIRTDGEYSYLVISEGVQYDGEKLALTFNAVILEEGTTINIFETKYNSSVDYDVVANDLPIQLKGTLTINKGAN